MSNQLPRLIRSNQSKNPQFRASGLSRDVYNTTVVGPARIAHKMAHTDITANRETRRIAEINRKLKARVQGNAASIYHMDVDLTNADIMANIYDVIHSHAGKTIVVVHRVNNEVSLRLRYELPNTRAEIVRLLAERWFDVRADSRYSMFAYAELNTPGAIQTVDIYKANLVPPAKIDQYFRDGGEKHCVMSAIAEWALRLAANNITFAEGKHDTITKNDKRVIQRYTKIAKMAQELAEKYDEGADLAGLKDICDTLNIDIQIYYPVSKLPDITVTSDKKRIRLFRYRNTRVNHVEYMIGGLVSDMTPIEKTTPELEQLVKSFDEAETYYELGLSPTGKLIRIYTLAQCYGISSKYHEACVEFEKNTGLGDCKLDDFADSDVCKFIQSGVHYNGCIDFRPNAMVENIRQADMAAAYANNHLCEQFEGYVGKVTDFRLCTKIHGIGYYNITNFRYGIRTPIAFQKLNNTMKVYDSSGGVFPSPELKLLVSMGCLFDITCGCWGDRFDFKFDESMMARDDPVDGKKQPPYYSMYVGACDMHHMRKRISIKNTMDGMAGILAAQPGCIVENYDQGFDYTTVSYPKKSNFNLGHISGFITSYQRICVMQQLMSMQFDTLIRVCTDGIYYEGTEDVKCYNAFVPKNDKMTFENSPSDSFISNRPWEGVCNNEFRPHHMHVLEAGGGGSGKTHRNLLDKGLVRVAYVAPTYALCRDKANEYGCRTYVKDQLLSDDPVKVDLIRRMVNVFILDELSMLGAGEVLKLFERYPLAKFYCCGDIGYQIPPIKATECDASMFHSVNTYTNDFRSKDEAVRQLKLKLRAMIDSKASITEMMAHVRSVAQTVDVTTLKSHYKINDYILTGTIVMKNHYTSMFAECENMNKWYVTSTTRAHSCGDIIISDIKPCDNCELRHGYTVNSVQGLTVKSDLYIDSGSMFSTRLLYTAVSRIQTIDQLYLVDNSYKAQKTGYIYKITSGNKCYIGSTTKTIEKRFKEHQDDKKAYKKNGGKWCSSFGVLPGVLSLVEEFQFNVWGELLAREMECIKTTSCINVNGNTKISNN
jgi:hypothetical protein